MSARICPVCTVSPLGGFATECDECLKPAGPPSKRMNRMAEADNLLNYVRRILEIEANHEHHNWTLARKAIHNYLGPYRAIPVNIQAVLDRAGDE